MLLFYHVYCEYQLLQTRFMKMPFRSHSRFSVGKMTWLVSRICKELLFFMFSEYNLIFARNSRTINGILVTKGYCEFWSVCSSSLAFLFVSKTFAEMKTLFFSWNLAVFGRMLSCAWESFSFWGKFCSNKNDQKQ